LGFLLEKVMKFTRTLLGLAGLSVFAFASAGTLYGTDTSANLYSIDTNTAVATLIGSHGLTLESLAYDDSTGLLYGADAGGTLFNINKFTGAASAIGNTGLGNIEGMDFAGPGLLYGFDFSSQPTIFTLDLSTAAATPFVQSDTVTGVVRTFCFDPTVNLALMATDNPSFQTLHGMLSSGVTTNIGSLGSAGIYGMDTIGNDLFGLGGNGELWSIDAATGEKVLIGNTGGNFWLGAASVQVVPEPATIAAIGLGLAAMARRRRKSA
jgi:hypothetical protein